MVTVYYNGQIYTGTLPLKEAFAVKDGLFLFVGNSAEVLDKVKKMKTGWNCIDLKR